MGSSSDFLRHASMARLIAKMKDRKSPILEENIATSRRQHSVGESYTLAESPWAFALTNFACESILDAGDATGRKAHLEMTTQVEAVK